MYVGFLVPDSRYHITLTFHGHDDTEYKYKRAVVAAAQTACHLRPFTAEVTEKLEPFGPNKDTWVALVDSPGLHTANGFLHMFLNQWGVPYSEDFDYRPHVTLTKFGKPKKLPDALRDTLHIDRLHVVSNEYGVSEVRL